MCLLTETICCYLDIFRYLLAPLHLRSEPVLFWIYNSCKLTVTAVTVSLFRGKRLTFASPLSLSVKLLFSLHWSCSVNKAYCRYKGLKMLQPAFNSHYSVYVCQVEFVGIIRPKHLPSSSSSHFLIYAFVYNNLSYRHSLDKIGEMPVQRQGVMGWSLNDSTLITVKVKWLHVFCVAWLDLFFFGQLK